MDRAVRHAGRLPEHDAVLLPRPVRRPPLMVGSMGPRMLSITLPHVEAWNAWGPWFGNSVEGYLPLRDTIDRACIAAVTEDGVSIRLEANIESPADAD